MFDFVLSPMETLAEVEIVERKGIGHPDSICDGLAETLSLNLCHEYQNRFGEIMHHNVDKALLCGGRANPAFGGGALIAPIQIYLAGRAVTQVGNDVLPIQEIAIEGSRAWLKANLHALHPERDVHIETLVQQGSQDLHSLFSRRDAAGLPLANDTSFGVGHAPLSALERLVLAIDRHLHVQGRPKSAAAWGEDTKVMAIRHAGKLHITVACAMIGRFLTDMADYLEQKAVIARAVCDIAREHGFPACEVIVNAADGDSADSIYLTVTGTSAEAGDDGQVGRGNRVNGLITPYRSMSLEAAAGKNPVSHVGKIYNVLASEIAEALVATYEQIASAECVLVSKIGAPVASPALVHVRLSTKEGVPIGDLRKSIEELVADRLAALPVLVERLAAGAIKVF